MAPAIFPCAPGTGFLDAETGPPKSPPETTGARRDQKKPKPIAQIPAQTAYLNSTGNYPGSEGLDGGVRSQIRTGLRPPLRLRELTGQNRKFGPFRKPQIVEFRRQYGPFSHKFPCLLNGGIPCAAPGNILTLTRTQIVRSFWIGQIVVMWRGRISSICAGNCSCGRGKSPEIARPKLCSAFSLHSLTLLPNMFDDQEFAPI